MYVDGAQYQTWHIAIALNAFSCPSNLIRSLSSTPTLPKCHKDDTGGVGCAVATLEHGWREGGTGSLATCVDILHPDYEQGESTNLQPHEDAQQRTHHVVGTQ